MIRMPRKIKDFLIDYVHQYAKRLLESDKKKLMLQSFNPKTAAEYAVKQLKTKPLTESERKFVESIEGNERIEAFFDEKLIVNYFMLAREISYYEAKTLLNDKGTKAFPETEWIESERYAGRFKDYPATDKQVKYIESFRVKVKHRNELSGREASLIISCLETPTKTRPYYFTYYI